MWPVLSDSVKKFLRTFPDFVALHPGYEFCFSFLLEPLNFNLPVLTKAAQCPSVIDALRSERLHLRVVYLANASFFTAVSPVYSSTWLAKLNIKRSVNTA